MAKGRKRMTGELKVGLGDDGQSLVTIRKQNNKNMEVSETRIRWVIDTDLTKLVEVKRNGTYSN